MTDEELLDLIAHGATLAVLRTLNGARHPLSIRALGTNARISSGGVHHIVQKLAKAGVVRVHKTKRDVLVEKAQPLPAWIGAWELDPPRSLTVTDGGVQLHVYRTGSTSSPVEPFVELKVLPEYATDEDLWLISFLRAPRKALASLDPNALDLVRLRRRLHQEGLEDRATRTGLAKRIGLQAKRGRLDKPRRDARRREATKDFPDEE